MPSNNRTYDKLIRRGARIASAFVSLAAVACGGSDSTAPENPYAQAAGAYTLVSLNGRALPALVFQDATMRVDITSATLVMRADRTFTETIDARVIEGTSSPQAERQVHNGTYTLSGNAAWFSVPAASNFPAFGFSGTLNGNVLSYTDENATYRYEKR